MKKNRLYIIALCLITGLASCNKTLDLQPLDKVSDQTLLASPSGIKTLVARLYAQMPVEDFNYRPTQAGFNVRLWQGVGQNITMLDFFTDDAHRSSGNGVSATNDGYWPYSQIREVNLFFESIEGAKAKGTLTEAQYNLLKSEAHFIRAYMYFGLVKRYGGVPLITKALDSEYAPGTDNAALFIPRSTEKEIWNFIMSELDLAVQFLPATPSAGDGVYRASKWAAYGLKSRAALFAASVAKYSSRVPLAGEAVNAKLVGMDASDAAAFYTHSINASKQIIDNSGKSLYFPTPNNAADAAKNFQNLFLTENSEIIFSKAYLAAPVQDQGHSYDAFYLPTQTAASFHKSGRYSPTLDIVDVFENYTDNNVGASAPIVTRTDGNENYSITNQTNLVANLNLPFRRYNSLLEPFVGKDARMLASIIVPGSTFKNTTMIIQGGIISPTGALTLYAQATVKGSNGVDYYAMGAPGTAFSGFLNTTGGEDGINYTTSGFSVKKYLGEATNITQSGTETSSTSWIDMRLGEIYLNYAEAVVESGTGDAALARKLLNDLRRRAAHMDNIPATLANVLKERRVELAFEGHRYWDLIRRREFHTLFNQTRRKALVPIQDLRDPAQPKFIFVRMNQHHDELAGGRRFENHFYYNSIPGRSTNNLVQNPVYN